MYLYIVYTHVEVINTLLGWDAKQLNKVNDSGTSMIARWLGLEVRSATKCVVAKAGTTWTILRNIKWGESSPMNRELPELARETRWVRNPIQKESALIIWNSTNHLTDHHLHRKPPQATTNHHSTCSSWLLGGTSCTTSPTWETQTAARPEGALHEVAGGFSGSTGYSHWFADNRNLLLTEVPHVLASIGKGPDSQFNTALLKHFWWGSIILWAIAAVTVITVITVIISHHQHHQHCHHHHHHHHHSLLHGPC